MHANEALPFGSRATVKAAILLPEPGVPGGKVSDPRIHYLQFTSSSSHQPIALPPPRANFSRNSR